MERSTETSSATPATAPLSAEALTLAARLLVWLEESPEHRPHLDVGKAILDEATLKGLDATAIYQEAATFRLPTDPPLPTMEEILAA
jgi:hypothetical protein